MTRSKAGNCPSIIREMSSAPADLEEQVVLAALVADVAVAAFGEQPAELEQRLASAG